MKFREWNEGGDGQVRQRAPVGMPGIFPVPKCSFVTDGAIFACAAS